MKKILAITLAGAMILSLAACAKSEAPAETEATVETVAETEAATEAPAEESTLIPKLKDAYYKVDADNYTEGEKFNDNVTAYLIDKNGEQDIVTYTVAAEGRTLEEYMNSRTEKNRGFWEIVQDEGQDLAVNSLLTEIDGKPYYCSSYTATDGDYFYIKQYVKHTKEVQFGNSSTAIYLPKSMTEELYELNKELFRTHYLTNYKQDGFSKWSIAMYEFDTEGSEGLDYDREKAVFERYGLTTFVEEDYFNELAKDGFTADEVYEYYLKVYGDMVVDAGKEEIAGFDQRLIEVTLDNKGTAYTAVYIIWVDEGKIRELVLQGPKETWQSMGGVVSQSVHKVDPVERMTGLGEEFDTERYEEGEVSNEVMLEGVEWTGHYIDKEGVVDVNTFVEKNTDGLTLEEHIDKMAKALNGCYNYHDFYGATLGLNTFLGDVDGETVINKTYTLLDGDTFYTKQLVLHTNEVQFGDTNQYLNIPKLIVPVEDEKEIEDYGDNFLQYFNSTISGLPDIGFYKYSKEDLLDYEHQKNDFETFGYEFVDKATFDAWTADGKFTLDELNDMYLQSMGSNVSENVRLNGNNTEYIAVQTERDMDGVYTTEFLVLWMAEDGGYNEMYLTSPADKWPNLAGPVTRSIHSK